HLPCAELVARAGKHIYTEKPIAHTLENGLKLEALQKQYNVIVEVGHSARLLKGTALIKQAIDRGELGTVTFMEANFSNERALELTPDTWRWYRDKAPGGPLSQLAIHQFNALHYLGGEISAVSSVASKMSPVGAEVDDQSMTLLKFQSGAIGYVGSSWTSPGIYSIRVFGQKALIHYELDFSTWDTPGELHRSSSLYMQKIGKGYGVREDLEIPEGDMFLEELDLFADACSQGKLENLTAYDGNIAIAVVNAALQSIENNGVLVPLDEVLEKARSAITN
ncbi:MAG: Gfo/Idh/MocA family protein, partial [Desulfobulbia bacterium]